MDDHVVGVGGQGSQILDVAAEHRTTWFGHHDDDRVDGGPLASESAQSPRSSSESLRQLLDDVARLEQPVDPRVVRWRPDSDSARTIEGTSGGHSPSLLNTAIIAAAS